MSLRIVTGGIAPTGVSFSSVHRLITSPSPPSIVYSSSSLRHGSSLSTIPSLPAITSPTPSRLFFHCNSNSNTNSRPPPGESESKNILDAFFIGKALAEAVSERIESTIGEILSSVGRVQAEQQNQVQQFQEDVLERAKRAKEKAAREAMEEQGLIPGSRSSSVISNTSPTSSSSANDAVTVTVVSSEAIDQEDVDQDPPSELSIKG